MLLFEVVFLGSCFSGEPVCINSVMFNGINCACDYKYELGSLFVFILMCYTYTFIEGLRKTMKNLSEQSVPGSRTEDRTR